jgi:tetratricopeptide (TPR) repeat protein
MEDLYAGNLSARANELAYHFFQGVRGEQGWEEALRYSLLAAERAEAVYANQEAVRHYRRALSLLWEAGQKTQRLQILEQLADVYAILEPREAIPLYEEALALWQETDGDRIVGARLHRKLADLAGGWAEVLGLPYDQERIQALIKTGLELLGDEPPGIEKLRLLLWAADTYDFETTWQKLQEAVALAERLGATDELALALLDLAWMCRIQGELRQARDLLCGHLEEIEQKADLQTQADIHRKLGIALGFMGEYPQAIECLKLAGQEYERAGHVLLACSSQFFAGCFYMQWDRWPEAFQSGVQTIERRRKHGLGPWWVPLLLAWVHAVWGDAEGVEKRRLEALGEKDERQPRVISYLSAQISMAQGDFAAARQVFEDTLAWIPPDHLIQDHILYPYLAECAARTGDGEAALHYAALAEEVARRGGSRSWLALALRAQGLVYTEREEWEQAEVCLEEALALFQGMGCRWQEGRTLVDLARLYRRRGESGDRERAWQHYQEALNRFEELWARPDVEQVQEEMLGL